MVATPQPTRYWNSATSIAAGEHCTRSAAVIWSAGALLYICQFCKHFINFLYSRYPEANLSSVTALQSKLIPT